jgi:hypothetical protein
MFHIRALSNIYTYVTDQQLHIDHVYIYIYIYIHTHIHITIHRHVSVARATVSCTDVRYGTIRYHLTGCISVMKRQAAAQTQPILSV